MALSPIWVPFSAKLIYDSQLRWLGPEKGVMHMAIGAVVNAAWVLTAKHQAIITGVRSPLGDRDRRRATPRACMACKRSGSSNPCSSPYQIKAINSNSSR
jgi:hypothetical protein